MRGISCCFIIWQALRLGRHLPKVWHLWKILSGRILLSVSCFSVSLSTLPVFCESGVTNNSGTDVRDAGWRQRCTAGFRCESYACGCHQIYHISYVNTANCRSRITWESGMWLLPSLKEKMSLQHKDQLFIFYLTNCGCCMQLTLCVISDSLLSLCPTSSSSQLREWGQFVRLRVQTLRFLNAVTCSSIHPRVQ